MWKLRIKWLIVLALGLVIITSLFKNPWLYVTISLLWAYIVWGCADKQGAI